MIEHKGLVRVTDFKRRFYEKNYTDFDHVVSPII